MAGQHPHAGANDAMSTAVIELPAPPAVIWDGLTIHQTDALVVAEVHPISRPGDRLGMGAVNHCVHGQRLRVSETVVG